MDQNSTGEIMKKFLFLITCLSFTIYSTAQNSISYVLPDNISPKVELIGNYSVLSEERILGWARAQGFEITEDNPIGGLQGKQAFLILPPGLKFKLSIPVNYQGNRSRIGNSLVLDIGALKRQVKREILSSDVSFYDNILRCQVYANNFFLGTIEMGYGVTVESPVRFPIPYVHDENGMVEIELRMNNHPAAFTVLYDAKLLPEN
jgi:hypothetical protein